MIIRTNIKAGDLPTNHNEKLEKDNKVKIDKTRRDLIKVLSLTGIAGVLTVAQSALSPVLSASPRAATRAITKVRSLRALGSAMDSNVVITEVGPGKAEVRFPKEIGYIRPGRNEFKDEDDLAGYLADVFPVSKSDGGGYTGSIKRVGKYQRINEYDRTVFTFGDPILDLITDENGILLIGGSRLDLRSSELEDTEQRGGGVIGLDPKPTNTPPPPVPPKGCEASSFWFPSPTAKPRMRFRAWSRSRIAYWSEGSDIETWGKDFTTAEITSQYGFFGAGFICVVAKVDSDHDTNDDYVDEYEWGIKAPRPAGHLSTCKALWGGSNFGRDVCVGCTSGWVNNF